jgi:ribosomal protein S18 acetylase RimI-like enzyme
MALDVSFRNATPEDAARLSDLGGPLFESDQQRAKWLEGWMRDGDHGLIADKDDARVGVAWYRRLPSPFAPDLPVAQASLRVSPDHARQGIGTTLMRLLLVAAQANGEHGLGAEVSERVRHGAVRRLVELFAAQSHPGSQGSSELRR